MSSNDHRSLENKVHETEIASGKASDSTTREDPERDHAGRAGHPTSDADVTQLFQRWTISKPAQAWKV